MVSAGSGPGGVKNDREDRHSLVLLVLLLFFLVLSAFLRDDWISESLLVISMYAILIVTILKVSEKPGVPRGALLLACLSMAVTLICVRYPVHSLKIANWLLLSVFFGYASVALFSFLERGGAIVRAKLMACLGLYLILGMFYYAVFNLLEEIHPGSFAEGGITPITSPRHSLIYLSLATLTTLGYGDIVPVSRPARMIAVLESITGVLYVAVTVARLVSAYQEKDRGGG